MFGRKSFRTCGTTSPNWQRRLARLISAASARTNSPQDESGRLADLSILGRPSPALRKIERILTQAFCKYGAVFPCNDNIRSHEKRNPSYDIARDRCT